MASRHPVVERQYRQNRLYLMNGATIVTDTLVNTVADLNWKVVGVGDFNSDGKATSCGGMPPPGRTGCTSWTAPPFITDALSYRR